MRIKLAAILAIAIVVGSSTSSAAQESDSTKFYVDPALGHDIRYIWTHGDPMPLAATHTQEYDGTVLPDGSMALLVDDPVGTAIYRFGPAGQPSYRGSTLAECMMGSIGSRLLLPIPSASDDGEPRAPEGFVVRTSDFEYIRTTASGALIGNGSLKTANIRPAQAMSVGPGGTVYVGGIEDRRAPDQAYRRAIVVRYEADDRQSWEWIFDRFPDGRTKVQQILPLADGSVLILVQSEAMNVGGIGPRGQYCEGESGRSWLVRLDADGRELGIVSARLGEIQALALKHNGSVFAAGIVHLRRTCRRRMQLIEIEPATGHIIREWRYDPAAVVAKHSRYSKPGDIATLSFLEIEQLQTAVNAVYVTVHFYQDGTTLWSGIPSCILAIEPDGRILRASGCWNEGFNLGVRPDGSAFLLSHRFYLLEVPIL